MSVMKEEVFTQLRENRRYNIPLHDAQGHMGKQQVWSEGRRDKGRGESMGQNFYCGFWGRNQ